MCPSICFIVLISPEAKHVARLGKAELHQRRLSLTTPINRVLGKDKLSNVKSVPLLGRTREVGTS